MSEIQGEWEMNKDIHVDQVTHECTNGKPCMFPYCEKNMVCNKKTTTTNTNTREEDMVKNVQRLTSVKQYFDYQETLNTLRTKTEKIENAQKEIYNNIKTDITSVFLVYDIRDTEFKINLTHDGIRIEVYAKKFNDYKIIHPIDTRLFYHLDDLMGVQGKMNIAGEKKIGGNNCLIIELIYELE